MEKVLYKPQTGGEVTVTSSKSDIHRALICSSLCNSRTKIICKCDSEDNKITAEAMNTLGAKISANKDGFDVKPISGLKSGVTLNCGNSASTLRLLLPVVASLGNKCDFLMSKELESRPISDLCTELIGHGAGITMGNPMKLLGGLFPGDYLIPGRISSQFASGLLIALSMIGGSLEITDGLENRPFFEETLDTLGKFGAKINYDGTKYWVSRLFPFVSNGEYVVEGDWSEAAWLLCAGVIGKNPIKVNGINPKSKQGSRAIVTILKAMGARIEVFEDCAVAYPSKLHGIEINTRSCPDIVPILAVIGCVAEGDSIFHGIDNRILKESSRVESIEKMIVALGGTVRSREGVIAISHSRLVGGIVDTLDHRVAMSGALASIVCDGSVTITNPECVSKSHKGFWDEFTKISKI
ncbi:MAG: 3-phosphoshikimate 1-carboxyvinyltransferase [Clostridia bacterium]|nr:3-phosphoshikimate 1-carboxyvinyltransferase [Clostridia bacterium]